MKIGLVVEGGGMKCAYHAAILNAFLNHNITFVYCIGASDGSGNLDGTLRMIEEDRYCVDISNQLLTTQALLLPVSARGLPLVTPVLSPNVCGSWCRKR